MRTYCVKACLLPYCFSVVNSFSGRRREFAGSGDVGTLMTMTARHHLAWGISILLFRPKTVSIHLVDEREKKRRKNIKKQQHILKIISQWSFTALGKQKPLSIGCLSVCVCVCVCIFKAHTGKTFQNNNISTFYNISLLVR